MGPGGVPAGRWHRSLARLRKHRLQLASLIGEIVAGASCLKLTSFIGQIAPMALAADIAHWRERGGGKLLAADIVHSRECTYIACSSH